MSSRKSNFSSLTKSEKSQKFTPNKIHNKIKIDLEDLKEYFKTHTLRQCAEKYNCSPVTIKRKLRNCGVDTSIHNQSKLAKQISNKNNRKFILTEEQLRKLYLTNNLDSKTIAERFGVHYNTVRKRIRQFKIEKTLKDKSRSMMLRHYREYGCAHPSQRADVLAKTRKSAQRVSYQSKSGELFVFRSLHELSYALYLDNNGLQWRYEEMRIPYVDNMSGKWKIYIIDFTVIKNEDEVEWVEVKPNRNMIPIDKRIYASRRAEDAGIVYRGLLEQERQQGWELLKSGLYGDQITFLYNKPRRNAKQISYYFKSEEDARKFVLEGWKYHHLKKHSDFLFTLKLRREGQT